jgi:hypothetical protein
MMLENWISINKKLKLNPSFIPYMKMNSKWVEDLNVRPYLAPKKRT